MYNEPSFLLYAALQVKRNTYKSLFTFTYMMVHIICFHMKHFAWSRLECFKCKESGNETEDQHLGTFMHKLIMYDLISHSCSALSQNCIHHHLRVPLRAAVHTRVCSYDLCLVC